MNGNDYLKGIAPEPKITVLKNGHVLDHHVLGYLAPMTFERWGFDIEKGKKHFHDNVKRNPAEQLYLLHSQLASYNIRFIYVALPCKLAIYPELAVNNNVLPQDRLVIPQWRKMLHKLLEYGVEVIDCYDSFRMYSSDIMLYSKNHHISPFGAAVVGEQIALYLKETTKILPPFEFVTERKNEVIADPVLRNSLDYKSEVLDIEYFNSYKCNVKKDGIIKPIVGMGVKSEIGIIGNCNLQAYQYTGCDITANLTALLNYPVINIGRFLPFGNVDTVDKIPPGALNDIKILIYVGFPSGSYVRAYHEDDSWGKKLITETAFKENGGLV